MTNVVLIVKIVLIKIPVLYVEMDISYKMEIVNKLALLELGKILAQKLVKIVK